MKQTVDVKLKWSRDATAKMTKAAVRGLFDMGYDIASQARANAPYVTGALRNSIRVEPAEGAVLVRAGGSVGIFGRKRIDYAEKREKGPNRDPSTVHYMRNAQRQVMSGDWANKYFGKVTK